MDANWVNTIQLTVKWDMKTRMYNVMSTAKKQKAFIGRIHHSPDALSCKTAPALFARMVCVYTE